MLVFIVQIHFFPSYIVLVIHDVSIYSSNSFLSWGILYLLYMMSVFIVQIHFFPNYIVLVIHDVSIYSSKVISFPNCIVLVST